MTSVVGRGPESVVLRGESETRRFGRRVGRVCHPGDIIALVGELGAGKTCLAGGVARGLGLEESVVVSSPTFSIVHEYPASLTVAHMDFYRLSESDLEMMGLEEILDSPCVSIIEWAERWPLVLRMATLTLCFQVAPDSRSVELRSEESRFLEVAQEWRRERGSGLLEGEAC